ncbi:MAG: hypothetical protein PHF70_10920, partial [Opitutales bacterium]|nr:hypothetical protein [Opitutales bacterium]
ASNAFVSNCRPGCPDANEYAPLECVTHIQTPQLPSEDAHHKEGIVYKHFLCVLSADPACRIKRA